MSKLQECIEYCKVQNGMPVCKNCGLSQEIIDEYKQAVLRNVPMDFVRQWINEDLLKNGHELVTNEDIQRFIDVALNNNK